MTPRAPQSKNEIAKLGEFFSVQIDPALTLFRSHHSHFGPLHYCTCGHCRFDPPRNMRTEYGCCCTADTPEVAVLEHLAGARTVPTTWAASRRISEVTARRPHRVADITHEHVGSWGIGAEIQVGMHRPQTQSWGRAFRKAGFEGILHKSRRANATDASCVAFFGLPGEHDDLLRCQPPELIDWTLLRAVERRFGIQCFPPTPLFD
ncbi:RES family NAD+ phosphorylase [Streptomyces bacillaris]|uniref:RES family NAD+ phosphorylase n=1 Tax=Streptomyces bacillaris TaxID=68179 RepID=UPI00380B9E88